MTRGLGAVRSGIALAAALGLAFLIFYLGAVTPRPEPVDAAPDAFSAGRAMADVRAMARRPHPVGSPADAAVRDYLIGRMGQLGLSPRVQRGSAFEAVGDQLSGAAVETVIGVLPGRDRAAPALALMAHHDSVAGSPGAADDTAGVASALEIIRAIRARGTPVRDVLLVMTDGEEAGLLGARAFFDTDPAAAHVGYVLNMETRGGGGRATMFEAAPGDGADIALYRRTAQAPVSNALTVFVYKHMPNDTDFTIALAHGKRGLNYAFIGRQFDYHSPSSTPEALDQGALQHLGAQVLPTAMALAFGPLPGRAPDVVYGNVIGDVTVAYPTGFGWVPLLAAGALIAVGAVRAARRGAFSAGDVGRGAATSVYLFALCGVLLILARRATGVGEGWTEYRPILARFPLFEAMMLAAALGGVLAAAAFGGRGRSRLIAVGLVLAAGGGAGALGGVDGVVLALGAVGAVLGALAFGAPAARAGAWTGLLLIALLAAVAAQVAAPTAGATIAWPLLAGALAAALCAAGADRGLPATAATVLIAAVTLAWLGGLFHQLLQGLDLPPLAAAPAWLAALVLWPLVTPGGADRASAWLAGAVVLLALVLAAWLRWTDPWSARHPNAVEPLYIVDPAAGRAWRASALPPDAWARRVLAAEGGAPVTLILPFERHPLTAASARPIAIAPPMVSETLSAGGVVTLVARPRPGAARLLLAIRSPDLIQAVRVDGRVSDFELPAGRWARAQWAGPEGFSLTFRARDPGRIEVAAGEVYDRWMASPPPPPPPPRDQLWRLAGSTLVVGRVVAPARPPR